MYIVKRHQDPCTECMNILLDIYYFSYICKKNKQWDQSTVSTVWTARGPVTLSEVKKTNWDELCRQCLQNKENGI